MVMNEGTGAIREEERNAKDKKDRFGAEYDFTPAQGERLGGGKSKLRGSRVISKRSVYPPAQRSPEHSSGGRTRLSFIAGHGGATRESRQKPQKIDLLKDHIGRRDPKGKSPYSSTAKKGKDKPVDGGESRWQPIRRIMGGSRNRICGGQSTKTQLSGEKKQNVLGGQEGKMEAEVGTTTVKRKIERKG